tara:strand:+ start:178 stop:420 length:243 start_codon:yes stop_codon:yes gene_type:complete
MGKPINVEVTLRRNEHPERMIKRFTRKVKKSGILDDYRERMYYTKKSAKRRRKKYLRKRKAQLAQQQIDAQPQKRKPRRR